MPAATVRMFQRLEEGASAEQREFAIIEMAQTYGNEYHKLSAELPGIHEKLDKIIDQQRLDRRDITTRFETIELAVAKLETDVAHITGSFGPGGFPKPANDLPPMRPKFDSTHDVAAAGGVEVARRIEAEARDPRTPSIPPPAKIAQISAEVMQIAVDRVKAEQWERLESERNAAEVERLGLVALGAREKMKAKWKMVGLALLAIGAGITAFVDHLSHMH